MTTTVEYEFNSLKDLVIDVLANYPEARDNDTYLYAECCRSLGAKTISDMIRLNLNIDSVRRCRQLVQNKLGLYPASEYVRDRRNKRKWNIRDYVKKIAN